MLDQLAIKYNADKSSIYHNYAEKYDQILSQFKEQYTNILEIGVDKGKSLKMWEEYFPNAIINGIDINSECKQYESERIKITITDQGDENQLKELEKLGLFDFIVDDGSHINAHQILTFKILFPFLKKGGIYVIEDIYTSYTPEYYGYGTDPKCMDYFKNLIDEVNYYGKVIVYPRIYNEKGGFTEYRDYSRREDLQEMKTDIRAIQFMNSMIIVYKK